MASRREQVLDAIKALVVTALPSADVARNRDKPQSIAPGGTVIVRDGDPGDPDVTLSPLTYLYDHAIPLEIGAYASEVKTASQVLDDMLGPIGAAVAADRTLGGLCDWLDVAAPVTDSLEAFGVEPGRWADVDIVATYGTTNPLA